MDNNIAFVFLKFGMVGLIGLIIDFGLTYFLKEKVKINKYVANMAGFSAAVLNNFMINKLWTFENDSNEYAYQFFLFSGIALVGLLINHSILLIFHHHLKMNFYISKLIAIGIVTIWNFSLNYFLTFRT